MRKPVDLGRQPSSPLKVAFKRSLSLLDGFRDRLGKDLKYRNVKLLEWLKKIITAA